MRIVTLNIRHGGGKRIEAIIACILSLDPDIIIFTEFRNNNNSLIIKDKLKNFSFTHQFSAANDNKNTVFIASKLAAISISLKNLPKEDFNRVCLIEINNFRILGVYFAQKNLKKSLFNYLIKNVDFVLNGNGLVIGDFNTGIPYIDESGKSFYCVNEFIELQNNKLLDAWRERNPNIKEFSWYSRSNYGYRIDHALITKNLNHFVKDIYYFHDPRLQKLSDHSALFVNIG